MPIQRGNRFVQMTYQGEVLSKLTTRDGGFFNDHTRQITQLFCTCN